MSPGVPHMEHTYLNLLDSQELLQILVTLTAIIKPLLRNFLGRAIVILNFVRRFRNFIAYERRAKCSVTNRLPWFYPMYI